MRGLANLNEIEETQATAGVIEHMVVSKECSLCSLIAPASGVP